jgi:hypothetical protein
MLVGDPENRDANKVPKQLCFRCEHNMQQQPFGGAPCTGSDTKAFPKGTCGGGWRVTVTFPSCWDGKNVDSPDHKSHIAYPASGTFESGGACPSSHPVKIPQVMYEIMYDTREFNNQAEWPTDGSQPFYWSHGDNTGYGIHGDYLFGWKGDALQRAMDGKCAGDRCAPLKRQSDADAIACTKQQTAREDIGSSKCKDTRFVLLCCGVRGCANSLRRACCDARPDGDVVAGSRLEVGKTSMLGVVVVCFCFRGFWGELLAQYLWDWRGYMGILALCCLPYVVRTCMTIFNLSFRSAMLPGRDYIFCVRNQLSKQGNDLLVPTATWLP